MPEFKIEDEVKIIYSRGSTQDNYLLGKIGIVKCIHADSDLGIEFPDSFPGQHDCNGIIKSGQGRWFEVNQLELIKSKGNFMGSIRDFYKSITKSEPEKSLNKAGLTDSNDVLTNEGREVFIAYLLEQNKTAFKTAVADPIIAAKADEKE